MMFQDGGIPALGPLATDRPHQLKAQFIYQFNFGTSIGVNQFVASGVPVTREIGTFGANNFPVTYLGRMSDGRTPTFSQTDMLVQHGFRIGGGRQLQVSLNILNLFNQDTATGKFVTEDRSTGPTPDQALFYAGQENIADLVTAARAANPQFADPRFLMDNAFQAPLQARFGVKFYLLGQGTRVTLTPRAQARGVFFRFLGASARHIGPRASDLCVLSAQKSKMKPADGSSGRSFCMNPIVVPLGSTKPFTGP